MLQVQDMSETNDIWTSSSLGNPQERKQHANMVLRGRQH